MIAYVAKRLLMTIPMLIGITFITYLAIALSPGGPAAGLMQDFNPKVSPEFVQKQMEHYNFDKPMIVQYGLWMKRIVKLDFGDSYKDNQPVITKIKQRIFPTLLLTLASVFLTYLLAIPIGIYSALKQNTWVDRVITLFVYVGFSIPTYWVALMAMIFFGIHLGWFPVTGFKSVSFDEMSPLRQTLDIAHHLILPVTVIGLTSLAGLSRYMRNGMLEVIRQDYIRTARAKGLSEKRVIFVHALRNSLIPIITLLGFELPGLLGVGVIFEVIFSYPGLGRLAYEAVMSRDTFLIMPTVMIGAFLTLAGNLLADVLYAYADPRIRYR